MDFRVALMPAATPVVIPGERSLIMASEDFSFMLEKRPGAYINIGNGDTVGSTPVHNPGYDFNDEILPIGAAALAGIVEKKLPRFVG